MRIAIDIDSTLHHYWDVLSEAAQKRFGIELPYEEQFTWGITRLKPEQLEVCIAETHCEKSIFKSKPYAGAVDTINRWHEAGHFIHITTHRSADAHEPTARWLEHHGLSYDELYCSDDKVARCVEIGIDLLIDDSPENLLRAVDSGIAAATILHPWNRDVVEEEGILAAADWPALTVALETRLEPLRRRAVS
ncbi:hypothetical protein NBH00_17115 [Paraconexibacter antarcticus]|uniref:Nucleotidase n=1 Tax=Paraconexibacter antarcticus TaxID=2949664 RepID=A0ABY5DQ85_9ACTN|nr:hypothetical protein [Paraconexibacter antarcticus]UTI63074.1 hypothetical protein NBH00_17115 [Paraconexibacter antarcticus]